ncbi:sigma E regulatory protein MucB/RseB [Psychromonas sp. CNPT3]|uniref:MucB/RseB C-terminal domain-containing protein n=1 Tax=Psychromonas sp. CNPT3 TaxID=314282 RepID=UPI00006E710E|nr:MucB/RseB C-terminal domain-containing protein [Psychromonas sp. CNPT3]AGH80028.1 sigma E regulatory protein MucB/RseB [Psychromonas sp. CNPT3]
MKKLRDALCIAWAFLFLTTSVFAQGNVEPVVAKDKKSKAKTAIVYLQQMQQAYADKNYEILYFTNVQNKVESMQLLHGVIDGEELAYVRYLNGAIRETLQSSKQISYFEQGRQPYTLEARIDKSVFAQIAHFNYQAGLDSYDYIIVGKGRIAGKRALAIRLLSKDPYRYSYVIWLDIETSLPLRLDTLSSSNLILEQAQVVSLYVTEDVNPWLIKVSQQRLPQLVHINVTQKKSLWKLNWLPPGFKVLKCDRHKLSSNESAFISYIMLSDGIVRISVYISPIKEFMDKEKIIQHGAMLIYSSQQGAVEMTVIGEIPIASAQRIVKSMSREKS